MENGITEVLTRLVFQLALILLVAKIGGEVCERYLKMPAVLGELVGGMIIGPYALGAVSFGRFGPVFEVAHTAGKASFIPISSELYAIAQIAVVILLFVAGLETNPRQFFRYGGPAAVVALGGVVLPFILGAYATVLFGFADSLMHPVALFMGAIMTATSLGISARVLSDVRKLDTPEGVTILGAAVIDDVLGILVLTIVVGVAATGEVSAFQVLAVGAKALGFWIGLTGIGFLLSKYISRAFLSFRGAGASLALALALAFFASGLAETFGLAMIIGAYSIGLAMSNTSLARSLEGPMTAVYHALVPIFFVVMGMLVNIPAMKGAIVFGIVISLLAIIGKVFGCGLPALGVGFNRRGSLRIGIGMLPRGEVALIIAGIALTRGVIDQDIFGVAVMMTIVTTILAPIFLLPAFREGGRGTRGSPVAEEK